MPQNALVAAVASLGTSKGFLLSLDVQSTLQQIDGGSLQRENITAAVVIKATPGRLARIIIIAPGTAGAWAFNDAATVGAGATANQIWAGPFAGFPAGSVIQLDFPCLTGIVCSAVPSAGSPQAVVAYF